MSIEAPCMVDFAGYESALMRAIDSGHGKIL